MKVLIVDDVIKIEKRNTRPYNIRYIGSINEQVHAYQKASGE